MSLKVLVVDDDEIIVFLHNMIMEDNGMVSDSLSFQNGKEAFDYLNSENNLNQTCLVLLDINMPVMNGWQLLDNIQSAPYAKNIHVVMVTSSIDTEDREKASQYPQVIAYFEKPLNNKSLKQLKELPQISPYFQF
ncbi:MAG TPA: response regulator [Emticicia sp.]